MLGQLKRQYDVDEDIITLYLWSFFTGTKPTPLPFYQWQNLASSLNAGKSLIRFSDDEAALIAGRNIATQTFNKNLRQELFTILKNYNNSSPYILATPAYAITDDFKTLKQKKVHGLWRTLRIVFKLYAPRDVLYTDSDIFFYHNTFNELIKPLLNGRHVIVVTKEGNLIPEFMGSLEGAAIIDTITTPAKNSYASEAIIKSEIEKKLFGVLEKPLIIFSCGAAAKTLTHHFANKGIQALDIGGGIEIIGKNQNHTSVS